MITSATAFYASASCINSIPRLAGSLVGGSLVGGGGLSGIINTCLGLFG
jgi:hypothetical protein